MKDCKVFRLLDGLRIDSTINSAVLLSTAPLLCILLGNTASSDPTQLGLFLLNIVFYVEFAYVINDYSDKKLDRLAGKYRIIGAIPNYVVFAAECLLFFANLAVWRILNAGSEYLIVLLIGLFLGTVYSLPPFRFKGRGFLGVLLASVFGRVLPIILACLLYDIFNWWFAYYIAFEGLRYILHLLDHQISDYYGDSLANVRTIPVVLGIKKAISIQRLLSNIGIPAALLFGLLMAAHIPEYRYILFAALTLMLPAVQIARIILSKRSMLFDLAAHTSFSYIWLSSVVCFQAPMWLSLIATWRNHSFVYVCIFLSTITIWRIICFIHVKKTNENNHEINRGAIP